MIAGPEVEAALLGSGRRICAWDHDSDGPRLVVFEVGDAGARYIVSSTILADWRDAVIAELRARGVRIGGCYCGHAFVWIADERGCTVWSREAVIFDRLRGALGVVTAVVSYVGDDHVRRGVRLARQGADDLVVAEEDDVVAGLDPTYGRNELLASDAWWIRACGRDLAAWLGVPHHDEAFSRGSCAAR